MLFYSLSLLMLYVQLAYFKKAPSNYKKQVQLNCIENCLPINIKIYEVNIT